MQISLSTIPAHQKKLKQTFLDHSIVKINVHSGISGYCFSSVVFFKVTGIQRYERNSRCWTDKSSGDIISRDWDLVRKGVRMTTEFGLLYLLRILKRSLYCCYAKCIDCSCEINSVLVSFQLYRKKGMIHTISFSGV
ncbi:hypothetical protein SAMN04488101_1072 [Pedobacter nyackensis]|uniref:Uncharacterized protein n=1 Tax=Pedobacter nyackensis TaxID=475255 RepID=A0A1W2DIF5_9SPHI|nr:hypothetical protein SAMN04488101_1072 [Pedobacter nyackensis]